MTRHLVFVFLSAASFAPFAKAADFDFAFVVSRYENPGHLLFLFVRNSGQEAIPN